MDRILSFSAKHGLLSGGGPILCALSGGRDSVALLHYLKTHGFPVAAAHFDHHLRPNSGDDAAFCAQLCRAWGVPLSLGGAEVGKLAGNTEANARAARYAFLERAAEEQGAAVIATAHNADDNLETVLLHLTRGCGLNGLGGIHPRRGRIVRPMLAVPRAAVDAYVTENALPFVEDETNADTAYARNKLRHRVVPVLKELNPRVAEAAGRMTEHVRGALACCPPAPPPAPVYPPLAPVAVTAPGQVDGPLWRLWIGPVERAPEAPPTKDRFYLRVHGAEMALSLRARRPGDYIRPPFRTGKSVKKWMNELGIPRGEREATPVLTHGERIVSVAGVGPEMGAVAMPGEEARLIQWTKKREEQGR